MRSNANVIVAASALVAGALCAQTPSPAPDARTPAGSAAQSASAPATAMPTSSAPARSKLARDPADARVCLEFPTNLQVIKCAEKYRYPKAPA